MSDAVKRLARLEDPYGQENPYFGHDNSSPQVEVERDVMVETADGRRLVKAVVTWEVAGGVLYLKGDGGAFLAAFAAGCWQWVALRDSGDGL